MAKLSVRLDKRRATDNGTFPLKIAFAREHRTAYIPLYIYVKESEWDNAAQKVIRRKDKDTLNARIRNSLAQASVRLLNLQELGTLRLLTDKEVVDILAGKNKEAKIFYFDNYFKTFISLVKNSRTRAIFNDTRSKLNSIIDNYERLKFDDITPTWLRQFETQMIEQGLKTNTRSIHLRNIRTVINAAIADEITSKYPFKKFKIQSEQVEKRALTVKQLDKLRAAKLPEWMEKYRDIFFLGLYLCGINIVDLSKLQEIKEGRIEYYRTKVARAKIKASIKVEPEALEIINKYKGENVLLSFFEGVSDYRHISNRLNLNLAEIAKIAELPKFTYYACRHTWATLAAELDTPKEVISLALAHSAKTVTDTYIKPNYTKIDAANRKVIDHILHLKEEKTKEN